jgi:hypothetical protein
VPPSAPKSVSSNNNLRKVIACFPNAENVKPPPFKYWEKTVVDLLIIQGVLVACVLLLQRPWYAEKQQAQTTGFGEEKGIH